MGRHMVETEHLKRRGMASGALSKKDTAFFLNEDGWHRVCAPEKDQPNKTYALIFWNKSHPNDSPTWDNQVRQILLYRLSN